MVYYSLLGIPVVITLLLEMYFIGKYISKSSDIFVSNSSASFLMGAVVYFTVSFIAFIPLVWLNADIVIYAVVLAIKDVIQITFLIIRRDVFEKLKVNWWVIGASILFSIIAVMSFNYGLNDTFKMNKIGVKSDFQTWIQFTSAINRLTNIRTLDITKWMWAFLGSVVIYNVINSFMTSLIKKGKYINEVTSIFVAFVLIILFNFHLDIGSLFGIFLLLFGVQLAIDIIMYSRRRFAVILGLLNLSTWFFDPDLYLAQLALSVLTIVFYIYLRKSKPSLFIVQILSPPLALSALYLYSHHEALSIIIIIATVLAYIMVIGFAQNTILKRLDSFIQKYRAVFLITILAAISIPAIVIGATSDISAKNIFVYKESIWSSFDSSTWNDVQVGIYYTSIAAMIATILTILIRKGANSSYKIAAVLSGLILVFAYSFIIKTDIYHTILDNQFSYLRLIVFAPLMMLSTFYIRKHGAIIFKRRKNV